MAAEFKARHAAMIAIGTMGVGPDAVRTPEQCLRTIRQMSALQSLMPSACTQRLAACTQQSADPRKQKIWREWLEQYAVASG